MKTLTVKQEYAQQLFNMLYQANMAGTTDYETGIANNDLPGDASHQDKFYGDINNAIVNLGYGVELEYCISTSEYDLDYIRSVLEREKQEAIEVKKEDLKVALQDIETTKEMILDNVINASNPEIELYCETWDFFNDHNLDFIDTFTDNTYQQLTELSKLVTSDLKKLTK